MLIGFPLAFCYFFVICGGLTIIILMAERGLSAPAGRIAIFLMPIITSIFAAPSSLPPRAVRPFLPSLRHSYTRKFLCTLQSSHRIASYAKILVHYRVGLDTFSRSFPVDAETGNCQLVANLIILLRTCLATRRNILACQNSST